MDTDKKNRATFLCEPMLFVTLVTMPDNLRRFQAGPDPFNRIWEVEFRWLQTGISIRHADTVDVKFLLIDPDGVKTEKTIALPHATVREIIVTDAAHKAVRVASKPGARLTAAPESVTTIVTTIR